ncbi:large ribosomal subunit protein mL48-like [Musca domestica]|uniref:Large ribosomal subunit protein mL48-like n=1 Tax=Musca domestica TaxID=7370 RepID=A0A1I8MEE8_MUSDO|nr:large ribosomal subunit protein mL48-like [Musca domestica]
MLRKLNPLIGQVLKQTNVQVSRKVATTSCVRATDVYEPDYLDSLKPQYPQYPNLNVQIKGYDYPILESYQRYLHNVAEYLDIDVADCYALPPQNMTVQRLKPNSMVTDSEYRLKIYERNIQLQDVDVPAYPAFLRLAQAALPEGVELTVQEHTDECEERRYVPDKDLLELKAELERMQSGGSGGKKK